MTSSTWKSKVEKEENEVENGTVVEQGVKVTLQAWKKMEES